MKVVVVGDALLDRDLDGPSTRLSPDAPVPVVDVERASTRPGGAGLVTRMLAMAGHRPTLVTALGNDPAARDLRRRLDDIEVVAGPSGAPTPVKTRVSRSGGQVVRFDEGCGPASAPTVTPAMLAAVAEADVVIAADYGRGLLANDALRQTLAELASHVPVVWDPHPRGVPPVPGTAAVTPNLAETLAATGRPPDENRRLVGAAAAELHTVWRTAAVVVTLGADGAWIQASSDPGEGKHLQAPARLDAVDPCGAGDCFAATLATLLGSSSALADAVMAAMEATATFLRGGGVGSLPAATPRRPHGLRPIEASELVERVRAAGGTVVATGGCFDLLHAGHVRTLRAARAHGDALIVCLNSDASVRRLKGPERPLMSLEDRSELLLALDCVDAVVVFDEDGPQRVLDRLHPDVWVKGGDYIAELLPEYELVTGWGGRCITVPFHPGRSTTSLAAALERIA
jgi:rfaE bifunctional protein nucleotidyltransferase chain/domain/rfaE bifunctional protein kinase chain/domain